MPKDISPEQKLDTLKLMVLLRAMGEDGISQCEKMRSKVRTALLVNDTDDTAAEEVATIIKQYRKKLEKLDGTYEEKRARKRARKEARLAAGSSFVETEAGSGDDESDGNGGDENGEDN